MFNKNDLNFILYKTKLPIKRLLLLIEEDRDFDLVIHSIASNLSDEDKSFLSDLSQKLKLKMILYNLSKDKDYDIKEKSYICDLLDNNYNSIYKIGYVTKNRQKREIKEFISVLNEKTINKDKKNGLISFLNKSVPNFGNHFDDWVNIIKESKVIIKKYV